MPTNLELLKSIHENGGRFEVDTNIRNGNAVMLSADKITDTHFSFKNNELVYRIPSVEEVWCKCKELVIQIKDKLEPNGIWSLVRNYDFDSQLNYFGTEVQQRAGYWHPHFGEHKDELTAGLMLWDKLLKETR